MFVVLDTNHFSALVARGPMGETLGARAESISADLFTTVITGQEVTQGWLAAINKLRAGEDQVFAYHRFLRSLKDFQKITILPFDSEAAAIFHRLQGGAVRVGTMDLKIAAICIAHDALLLTRNTIDFQKIPDLRFQNWLD